MATPEGHLIMCDWYYARAISDFQTAKFSDKLEDKVGYFASSAEFLLILCAIKTFENLEKIKRIISLESSISFSTCGN